MIIYTKSVGCWQTSTLQNTVSSRVDAAYIKEIGPLDSLARSKLVILRSSYSLKKTTNAGLPICKTTTSYKNSMIFRRACWPLNLNMTCVEVKSRSVIECMSLRVQHTLKPFIMESKMCPQCHYSQVLARVHAHHGVQDLAGETIDVFSAFRCRSYQTVFLKWYCVAFGAQTLSHAL